MTVVVVEGVKFFSTQALVHFSGPLTKVSRRQVGAYIQFLRTRSTPFNNANRRSIAPFSIPYQIPHTDCFCWISLVQNTDQLIICHPALIQQMTIAGKIRRGRVLAILEEEM